ncbi:MAG: DNA alkylation repair protein [Acidimicrobiales bacterium]|jgi:3-methyladenine DNA glycosylase AlkD
MDVGPLAEKIDDELRAAGSPERAVREKAYLKSALDHYGATMPVITSIAKAVRREHPELDHDDLVALGVSLWSRPVHERRMTAAALFELNSQLLDTEDVPLLERWLRESRTWALVDGIAASVVGPLVERRPELRSVLDRWACDDDFWIRRSALLGLLPGLRQGAGDFERFSRYADSMLDDKEFFIRKAIGWVLRDTAWKRPGMVFEWLLPPRRTRLRRHAARGPQAALGRAADGGPRRPVKR